VNGRHIAITGATGALGTGVVDALLARGAHVHLPIVEPALPHHLPWRNHAHVHAAPKVSLDDEPQVGAFFAALPELWASIHLVGGFLAGPIGQLTLAELEAQWRLNVVTCFLACREAVKVMRRGGAGGRIVNVGARPVVQPTGGMLAYTTAKAGVAALTQGLAQEVLAEGILVNAVLPSVIDSPANRVAMPNADHASWPKPAQLAQTIMFLASPENSLTTGTLVPVFGRA
jgi:NAD(P)-dependent dehydrogenase (short-subunit alcohol dehydrogenase family)